MQKDEGSREKRAEEERRRLRAADALWERLARVLVVDHESGSGLKRLSLRPPRHEGDEFCVTVVVIAAGVEYVAFFFGESVKSALSKMAGAIETDNVKWKVNDAWPK